MSQLEIIGAEYEKNGFAIIRNVLDEATIEEARRHIAWLIQKYPALRPEHFHHPLIRDDAFWVRLISDSRLVDIAEFFLGPDVACFTAHYICKPPNDGQAVLWHQDGAYWNLEPMEALTVWLAVDDSTTENGCLRMIPGSHRLPLHPPNLRTDTPNMLHSATDDELVAEWIDRQGEVAIELAPGDISIHHPNILHHSEVNTSDKRRCGLDIGYMSTATRISNEGLYLDPVLVRGRPTEGVNSYRRYPLYDTSETIPFSGSEGWNEWAESQNTAAGLSEQAASAETPLATTQRMIERLRTGTVKS